MSSVTLVHRWDGSPKSDWYPWLRTALKNKGFNVVVIKMPNPGKPIINEWVAKLEKTIKKYYEENYLIGHSIGCQTIMRYLEKLPENYKFKGIILVAPWLKLDIKMLEKEGQGVKEIAMPWIETPINLHKVKKHSDNFTILYSTSDPYVSSRDLLILKEGLDASFVNVGDLGHFTEDDGIKKLPEIMHSIDEIESGGI